MAVIYKRIGNPFIAIVLIILFVAGYGLFSLFHEEPIEFSYTKSNDGNAIVIHHHTYINRCGDENHTLTYIIHSAKGCKNNHILQTYHWEDLPAYDGKIIICPKCMNEEYKQIFKDSLDFYTLDFSE